MSKLTSSSVGNKNKRCSWAMARPGSKGDFQCGLIIQFRAEEGVPLCHTHRAAFVETTSVRRPGDDRREKATLVSAFADQRAEAQRENKDLVYRISRLQGEKSRVVASSDATIKALRAENNRLVGELKVVRDGLASNSKVYLIKCGDQVKIGRSGNPEKRLSEIKRGNACLMDGGLDPAASELLYEMPGHVAEETELHRRFRAYRTTGEWFRIEGELSDYIRGLGVMVTQG